MIIKLRNIKSIEIYSNIKCIQILNAIKYKLYSDIKCIQILKVYKEYIFKYKLYSK